MKLGDFSENLLSVHRGWWLNECDISRSRPKRDVPVVVYAFRLVCAAYVALVVAAADIVSTAANVLWPVDCWQRVLRSVLLMLH